MDWSGVLPDFHEASLSATKNATTITLLRLIPTMTFQNSHDRFFVSLISCQVGVVRHTSYLLKCLRLLSTSQTDCRTSSDILSDISPEITSDISSGILPGISPGFLSDILSDIPSGISPGILSDIPSGDISSDILADILSRDWGAAGNAGLKWSRLRPGREHWARWLRLRSGREHWPIVAVEVRQGTLGSDGRGWGPAGNTEPDGCGWGPAGNTGRLSRLRSGREHWVQMVAVEVRQGTLDVAARCGCAGGGEEEKRREEEEEEEEKTNIKSNNPHLTGGEKRETKQQR